MRPTEKVFQVCECCMEGFLLGIHVARGLGDSVIRVESGGTVDLLFSWLPVLACKSHEQLQGRLISN